MKKIDTKAFLELAEYIPVIDVRSPLEFNAGHIPGALSIPLFNDEERVVVGTKFKKNGRNPAIIEGLKLTGPTMSVKLEQALAYAGNGKLLVHCWRGGMRSEAMAWLFSLGGIETMVLEGGYKSYRNYILESLSGKRKIIVLGGMTGSSKTHILRFLREKGEMVIDLERIANHKGSAFGSLGQPPQPTTEQFANNLYYEWTKLTPDQPVWLEDESRSIGSVFIPDSVYLNMQDCHTIILTMDVRTRLPRLLEEYTKYPPEDLKASIMKISKRLGGDNTKLALEAVEARDFARAIEITLSWYDKAYLFGLKKKKSNNLIYVETDSDNIELNASKVLEAAQSINW